MKKFLAMMLAVLMLLSMATVAMADDTNIDHGTWNITNIANAGSFDLVMVYTNGEHAPDETFSFTITPTTDGDPTPTITVKPSNKSGVLSNTITVKLPTYTKVGTYEYTMKEVVPENPTEGVTYDTEERTLKVYVENTIISNQDGTTTPGFKCQVALIKQNGKKDDQFKNVYNDGTLVVKKTVETDVAVDKDNDYSITVKLTGVNNVSYNGVITRKQGSASATEDVTFTGVNGEAQATFTLKDTEYLTIEHLPQGAKYEVSEANATPNGQHVGEWNVSGLVTAEDNKTIAAGTNTVEVTNKFAYKGSLVISKTVTGNYGDMVNDEFKFTITINKPFESSDFGNKLSIKGDNTYEATLKHGESVTLTGIPYGASYTVTETTKNGYAAKNTLTEKFNGGAIDGEAKTNESNTRTDTLDHTTEELVFTNTNQQPIETGVSLDTLPYVLVLALAGAGLVLMIARKRRVQD